MIGEESIPGDFPNLPYHFESAFQDASSSLKLLVDTARMLFIAYELKRREFNKITSKLSSILDAQINRRTGVYLDFKNGYYYIRYKQPDSPILKSKYIGKNPGNIISLIQKFQELKSELNRLENYQEMLHQKLTEFVEDAKWLTNLVRAEVSEYVDTK